MTNFVQKIIDKIRGKKRINSYLERVQIRKCPKTTRKIYTNKKFIAVSGFSWSGASALVDLLSEFDDRIVYGGHSRIKEDIRYGDDAEFKFLKDKRSIFNLIKSYEVESPFEQDLSIKKFITVCYEFSNVNYPIFGNNIIKVLKNFLENILELDDYTKEYIRHNDVPCTYKLMKNKDLNLSFIYGKPYKPYVFYEFKKMTVEEFDQYVCDFFWDFFNNAGDSTLLIFDQIFSYSMILDTINFYMNENPFKEICVYRDPRDSYIDALCSEYSGCLRRNTSEFINKYKNKCIKKLNTKSENRLCIRFEDLCLDYDKTLDTIINFLDIKDFEHLYKKQIFIPEQSKNNIGIYKYLHDQNIIKEIAGALGDYCYNG